MEKLWNPQIFDRVLDNWSENPFVEMKILDFTTDEYKHLWDKNYQPQDGETINTELNFDCPKGFDELGSGYWYGLKDGCICNGIFGGDYNINNKGAFLPLSLDDCSTE